MGGGVPPVVEVEIVEQAATGAWNWMEHSAYELGGALDKLFSAFHMDPNGET